jgi:hypothetical protein
MLSYFDEIKPFILGFAQDLGVSGRVAAPLIDHNGGPTQKNFLTDIEIFY